jgi:hypothetical protein
MSVVPTVLGTVAVILMSSIVFLLAAPTPEYEAPTSGDRVAVPVVSVPDPFAPPPITQFSEVDDRPLFVPERRFVKEVAVEAPPAPPRARPNATLVGIIIDGERKIAVAKIGAKSIHLVPGATIDGWTVVAIEADRVAVEADDENYYIGLPNPVPNTSTPRPPPGSLLPKPPGFAPGQIPGRP